jgi:hypothetical protein
MGSPRDPVTHIPKKDDGPTSFPLMGSNLNTEIVVRDVHSPLCALPRVFTNVMLCLSLSPSSAAAYL